MLAEAEKVQHMALINDALGYYIKSFDINGHEKYTEVKYSTRGEDSDFIFTEKEIINVSTLENYFLYRVFNLDFDTCTGDIYIINCNKDFNSKFSYWPVVYSVRPT